MTVHEKYNGRDQVHTANCSSMLINHVGHSTFHTLSRNLHLKNILHVPNVAKNLLSVHRLASDNNAFLEFHPHYFLIKDRTMRRSLYLSRCESGLYPLVPNNPTPEKEALSASKPTPEIWHSHLGHPSYSTVQQVLRSYMIFHVLVFPIKFRSVMLVNRQKSHQLPYSSSNNVSSAPLELVFFDVWGPAPTSSGGYKYYWDESFLTASFLINRLPSKVIHSSTPIELLLGTKPDYSFLRFFGCVCWPNLRPYNNRKLQFRSKQCVFLGYSNLHMGYKCLDIPTSRIYISQDVIFDETVFRSLVMVLLHRLA